MEDTDLDAADFAVPSFEPTLFLIASLLEYLSTSPL